MPLPKNEKKHTYTVELPSGRSVKFHPWVVREEQEYMYATEGLDNDIGMIEHIEELLNKCIEDDTKLSDLSEVDFLALCVEIRKRSKGEQHEIVFTCPHCDTVNDGIFISLVDDISQSGMKSNPIEVGDSEYTFRDISREKIKKLQAIESPNKKNLYFLIYSLASVSTLDQTYTKFSDKEAIEFFESMDPQDFKTLSKEFSKILPVFAIRKTLDCERCNEKTVVFVDKVTDFFV